MTFRDFWRIVERADLATQLRAAFILFVTGAGGVATLSCLLIAARTR